MTARPIDLPRARRALAELDRIAAEHPEIRHRGKPWGENMNQLQEIIMTPSKQRDEKYRAKQRERGLKPVTVYLTPPAQAVLNKLQSEQPDANMGDIISNALLRMRDRQP